MREMRIQGNDDVIKRTGETRHDLWTFKGQPDVFHDEMCSVERSKRWRNPQVDGPTNGIVGLTELAPKPNSLLICRSMLD